MKTTEVTNNNLERPRINIERRTGHNYSYYIDVNGLLKGEWGGFKDNYGVGKNGEQMYGVYYIRSWKESGINYCDGGIMVPVDEFGYFYNKFSCEKYDSVYKAIDGFYKCVKNNRLGLIDEDENILLHTVYNNIVIYRCWSNKQEFICIVTTETGKFIYNILTKKISKEYDDVFYFQTKDNINIKNHFIFKSNNKYGILDTDGNIILPAKYDFERSNNYGLYNNYSGFCFNIFVDNGLLYNYIPVDRYDKCFRVGSEYFGCYYITELCGKYGILSSDRKCIKEPYFDEIILYNSPLKIGLHKIRYNDKNNKYGYIIFVIARKNNKYWLYNAIDGKSILEDCDDIRYHYVWNEDPYIEFTKETNKGYVMGGGVVLSFNEYDNIVLGRKNISVFKNGKQGLLNIYGFELLPCIYNFIKEKSRDEYLVVKDDNEEIISFYKPSLNKFYIEETHHYSRYEGSYAQEEMGYSDEDIDTIFDGDPTAYWNID